MVRQAGHEVQSFSALPLKACIVQQDYVTTNTEILPFLYIQNTKSLSFACIRLSMAHNLVEAKTWLSQVNAHGSKKQDALVEAQIAKQEWNSVLQSLHDRSIQNARQTTEINVAIPKPACEAPVGLDGSSPNSTGTTGDLTKAADSSRELQQNPFRSPFDSPFDDPSPDTDENEDDDEDFGEFVSPSHHTTPLPPSRNPFKKTVHVVEEDSESALLLPSSDLPESTLQPAQYKFNTTTRGTRRDGNRTLHALNIAKANVQHVAQTAFAGYIQRLSPGRRVISKEF